MYYVQSLSHGSAAGMAAGKKGDKSACLFVVDIDIKKF